MKRRELLNVLGVSAAYLSVKGLSAETANVKSPLLLTTWHNQGVKSNPEAWSILQQKGQALDAVEKVAFVTENDWDNCCVGLGGNPDRDGVVTLDASIMNHHSSCGSVVALEGIKHPILVARKLMETTPHVMLAGAGALQFALENGFIAEPHLLSDHAKQAYDTWLKKSEYKPQMNIEQNGQKLDKPADIFNQNNHDTVGTLALDVHGNISGACTTSGMAFKMHGRVGDSPIIGAGLYIDNEIGGATCSGLGEEVIRVCGSFLVVEFMRQGLHPSEACKKALERIVAKSLLKPKDFQVGFIALNKKGEFGGYSLNEGFDFTVSSTLQNHEKVVPKSLY